jgi:DNA-binding CsgD family transcriptional regulator
VETVAVVIVESGTHRTLLSVLRHGRHGIVDEAVRERMRLVASHIRRSMIMGRQIEAGSRTVADLARALDVLRTAICLLDDDGRVVHANTACRRLFADADILTTVGDRIVARNGQADRMLRGLLSKAEGDEAASGVHNQTESLRSADGAHYLAHALALTRERRHPAESMEFATSVLFVWKVSVATSSASGAIADAFKLTPSELRVLTAIVEIGGVPEVAATLGIAETTVKTHLSRLFEKMGVSRQAGLVKIVAGFSTPLVQHNDRE